MTAVRITYKNHTRKKNNQNYNANQLKTKKSLQDKFGKIRYALCDEYSMIGKSMLASFHRALSIANLSHQKTKQSNEEIEHEIPFGGVNMIYFGDILQYKPVKDQALHTPVYTSQDEIDINIPTTIKNLTDKIQNDNKYDNTKHDNKQHDIKITNDTQSFKNHILKTENKDNNPNYLEYAIGRSIWLQTKHAVVLKHQIRIIDKQCRDLLERLRNFQCNKQDHELLLTRVIGSKNCDVKNLDNPEWRDATILVFSNEIRQEINNHTSISRSIESRNLLTVCVAKDVVSIGNNIVPESCSNILNNILKITDDKTDDLPGLLPLIPGMPVMLTENICTQLGLTNGTNGIFRKLIYDKDSIVDNSKNENLLFPIQSTVFVRNPITALVEISSSNINGVFEGLPNKIIPIPLVEGRFTINSNKILNTSTKKFFKNAKNFTIKRIQFTLVSAYAITTYKSQGQTMNNIVIDLVLPPFACKEIATPYVPLSRAPSLNNILILRDFKFESINIPQTVNQKLELENIENMNLKTKLLFDETHKG